MKRLWFLIAGLALPLQAQAYDHNHQDLTELLGKVVVYKGIGNAESQVDYKKLQKEPKLLNKYLKEMGKVPKKTFESWTKDQQKAFLINAYNAFTLKLVVDHYPVNSIKKIGGLFSTPWKMKFIRILGRADVTLDQIEHKMLRKNYNEPRVHFAVNCASIGCPRLRNEAFTAEKLEAQLEEQTKLFMLDTTRNELDASNKVLRLSKIFDWFEEDFTKDGNTVSKFASKYMTEDPAIKAALVAGEYKVKHLSYDWDLNDLK